MILGICGKSGSGKDTLINMIKANNKYCYKMVKASDRPLRIYEKNGQDYWCFTKEDFKEAEKANFFITTQSFKVANGEIWDYGIFKNDFKECLNFDYLCLVTLTPYEVETLYNSLKALAELLTKSNNSLTVKLKTFLSYLLIVLQTPIPQEL